MKKNLLLFTILSLAFTAIDAQVKWSVNAGVTSTNNYLKEKLSGGLSHSSHTGFTVGGAAAFKLFSNVSSETGLSLSQKGFRYRSAPIPDYTANVLFKLNYLVLNQNFMVKFTGKNGLSFSTGTGFFAAAAVNGRYIEDNFTIFGYRHGEAALAIGNSNDDNFKRIDAGLNILVRSQYKNVQLTMQFSPSFTNHVPGNNNSYKEKLRSVAFTLGYEF
jgi:hypothetical protein